ncbi:MAG: hypothetical protein JST_000693 [Candidatus Parcubacteria bacterium]|jgi:hypothetical protein|nr:MAG: hypothetical protein JST_6410 [Candidatus Parcubacteria bacterium]
MKHLFYSFIGSTILIAPRIALASSTPASGFNDKMDAQTQALTKAAGLGQNTSLSFIIATLIQVLLGFLGIIFLILTIVSGFKWMTAQGNEDTIKKAKGTLMNAIIGLVIVLAAYIITTSLFKLLPFSGGSGGVTGG